MKKMVFTALVGMTLIAPEAAAQDSAKPRPEPLGMFIRLEPVWSSMTTSTPGQETTPTSKGFSAALTIDTTPWRRMSAEWRMHMSINGSSSIEIPDYVGGLLPAHEIKARFHPFSAMNIGLGYTFLGAVHDFGPEVSIFGNLTHNQTRMFYGGANLSTGYTGTIRDRVRITGSVSALPRMTRSAQATLYSPVPEGVLVDQSSRNTTSSGWGLNVAGSIRVTKSMHVSGSYRQYRLTSEMPDSSAKERMKWNALSFGLTFGTKFD